MAGNLEAIITAAKRAGWRVSAAPLARQGVSNDEPDVRFLFEREGERWTLVAQGRFGALRHVRGLRSTGTSSAPADLRAAVYVLGLRSPEIEVRPGFHDEQAVAEAILHAVRAANQPPTKSALLASVGHDLAGQMISWLRKQRVLVETDGRIELAPLD